MVKEFWTITEVVELFQVDERFLADLEDEEILCPVCRGGERDKLFPPKELEKLRLAMVLMEDMGVNLAGVDVILRMRQNMDDMRNQFDAILEDLAGEFQAVLKED
jgi:MerR family transcriptional regulator/heat shock protein HspR